MMIRVCTYNILSTKLVSPDWHIGVPGKYLATEYRWNLIKEKLSNKIKDNYIISIQELSEEWLSKLLIYFRHNNYMFVYDSAYLGVGIAFSNKYNLKSMNIVCVGEELRKSSKPVQFSNNLIGRIFRWFSSFQKKDNWQLALDKRNRYVRVTLSNEISNDFDVYTYHMPCAFTNPDLMLIQACGLLNCVEKEAEVRPYILTGDFNSRAYGEVYNMITEGKCREVKSNKFTTLPRFNTKPLKSAYKEANCIEPVFTCSAWSKQENKLFRDTIDYIFYSNGFEIDSAKRIIFTDTAKGPYPCETEPSDHILIGADLKLTD